MLVYRVVLSYDRSCFLPCWTILQLVAIHTLYMFPDLRNGFGEYKVVITTTDTCQNYNYKSQVVINLNDPLIPYELDELPIISSGVLLHTLIHQFCTRLYFPLGR